MKKDYGIHKSSIVEKDVKIGSGTQIWHFSHIMPNVRIGKNCSIGQNVFISEGVRIGNNVKIQNNVSIYSGVTLENYVFCGPSVVFTNVLFPRSKYPKKRSQYRKTCVKQGATIGANATIVCGNEIGSFAFIGAGSVVTSNVGDYRLSYGNPAREKGWICECGSKLMFKNRSSVCGRCRRSYIIYKCKCIIKPLP